MPEEYMHQGWRIACTAVIATILSFSGALADDAGAQAPAPANTTIDGGVPKPSADNGPKDAPRVAEKKFGEWTLQCATDKSMNPPCQVIYRLVGADERQVMVVISMAKASKDTVGFQMALPLGFSIQSGVKIAIGAKFSTRANVSRCTIQGCLIEGIAPAPLLAAMLKEKSGQVSIQMMQGNILDLSVKLDGFHEAFDAMSAYKS
jgi:invasion protein IalB